MANLSSLNNIFGKANVATTSAPVKSAVVEKKLVDVAFENNVLPLNVFVPENVLLSARSVEEANLQVDVEYV